jgi:hypothetical protein
VVGQLVSEFFFLLRSLITLQTGFNPEQSQRLYYIGSLMRQVFLNIHQAFHGILLKHGLDQATLDQWSAKVEEGDPALVPTVTD